MISKNRKKTILTCAVLSIAMILANVLQAGTVSFFSVQENSVRAEFSNLIEIPSDTDEGEKNEITLEDYFLSENDKENSLTQEKLDLKQQDISGAAEITFINSDEKGIELEFSISELKVEAITSTTGEIYQRLSILGGGRLAEIGKPELPTKGIYLEVPEGVDLELNVRDSIFREEDGYNIYPYQAPLPDLEAEDNQNFEKDISAYQRDSFYPSEIAGIIDVGIIRGHRTILIIFCPVTYNPHMTRIRIYSKIDIQVKYNTMGARKLNDELLPNERERYNSESFQPLFKNLYLNYQEPLIDNGDTETSYTESFDSVGADYLIITPDQFYDNMLPLVQNKEQKGLATKIVKLSEIGANPTANDISAYIQNTYDTWTPAPSYLLLVGDVNLIPPHYETIHPYYTGGNVYIPTDLYYATVDGSDYFPDIFAGRLPIQTATELDIVVNKIINYENNFNRHDAWRQNVLLAAYDQSGRYFMETSESIRQYLESEGYLCNTVYTGGLNTGTTQDIIDYINDGTFLINHRDHGSPDGWFEPSFEISDISSLNNNDMLPVMFSINCESGYFDGASDCFGEALIKAQDKGVVGFIGSSRVSYSGYNDELDKGLITSIWPDYYPEYNNYVGNSPELGPTLNFGKIFMYDKYVLTGGDGYPFTPSETITLVEFEEFTLFGDPELSIYRAGEPIHIDNNAWNDWAWAKNEFDLPGSGEEWDPYVIQDFRINAGDSGSCILIENSDAHFRIENCKVYNSGSFWNDAGIKLINTINGEIIDNDCSQNYNGIFLLDSNDNTISGNTANKNDNIGIYLLESEQNTVSGNTVNETYFSGIYLANSDDTTITENTFSDNSISILIQGTSSYNTFYLNSFYRSTSSHVFYFLFSGSGDSWDYGSIGNYWDDYTGVDDDDDGIGDTPYYKNGVIDNYPIWDDGPYGGKIHIDDSDPINNWAWASTRIWCSGSGMEFDPYVIQDLILDAGGSGSCILIENSNAYFRIENCEVYNSGPNVLDAGIKLYNTINGKIINNDCSQNENGIFLWDSNDNTVSGNTANNNDNIGIPLVYSDDNTISGNTVNDNSEMGLFLLVSERNTVSGNIVNDNDAEGLNLYSSDDNIVTGNTFVDNSYGFLIMGTSSDNTFYLNSFYRSSMSHAKYDASYTGTGNSWDDGSIGNYWDDYNEKYPYATPIGNIWNTHYEIDGSDSEWDYYPIYSHEPIHIDDNAGNNWEWARTQYWCSGFGTEEEPYIIQYRTIDVGASGSCILIENSDAYFRIENCKVYNSGSSNAGIKLYNTTNGKIIDNDCSENYNGIFLMYSNDNTVSGNIANDNDANGIIISNSDDNTISGNTANNNYYNGIRLYSSNGNTISGNTVNNNGDVYALVDCAGIYLWSSNFNTISGNILINNGRVNYYDGAGIYLTEGSALNILKNNLIIENSDGISIYNELYAISLTNSYDNTIYLNSFYGTEVYLWDYWSTHWDYGGLGNYWDDYEEKYPSATHDGNIWDTPYVIDSSSGMSGTDNYPLIKPYDSRNIESPIYIDDTAWNNWEWAKSQDWCDGSGTKEDPYVIKDLIINGGGSAIGSCISIKNSDVYFRIENCKVYNSGFQAKDAGIILINTKNGEIINNDVSENWFGITLWNSDGNTLRNNILVENLIGIIVRSYSSENSVLGNSFLDNQGGILIQGSLSDNTINYNSFYGSRSWDFYYV